MRLKSWVKFRMWPFNPSNAENRLGVITFNVADLSHAFVAAVLSYEWAIGTYGTEKK
jgi:hypothetical protein